MITINRECLAGRAAKLARISSEFTFQFSKLATAKQVAWRQKQINRPIPEGMVQFACSVASRVEIRWEFERDILAVDSFDESFPSSGEFSFSFFETDVSKLDGWEDSFENWQDYKSTPNPFEYAEIFPVFELMNGDLIVELIGEREQGSIYYLDHESGAGDWKRLAMSFEGFIQTLSDLWFPSLDWYDSLGKFFDAEVNCISIESPFAKKWKAFVTEVSTPKF